MNTLSAARAKTGERKKRRADRHRIAELRTAAALPVCSVRRRCKRRSGTTKRVLRPLMASEHDGRVSVVTGGARGIGLACATELARAGCPIAVCDLEPAAAEAAAAELGRAFGISARGYACDVRSAGAVRRQSIRSPSISVASTTLSITPAFSMSRRSVNSRSTSTSWSAVSISTACLRDACRLAAPRGTRARSDRQHRQRPRLDRFAI